MSNKYFPTIEDRIIKLYKDGGYISSGIVIKTNAKNTIDINKILDNIEEISELDSYASLTLPMIFESEVIIPEKNIIAEIIEYYNPDLYQK